jgi:hypothetical protein
MIAAARGLVLVGVLLALAACDGTSPRADQQSRVDAVAESLGCADTTELPVSHGATSATACTLPNGHACEIVEVQDHQGYAVARTAEHPGYLYAVAESGIVIGGTKCTPADMAPVLGGTP